MTEKLLQYIWQFQYFNQAHLSTIGGERVFVLMPGAINNNGGPDFTNAKIQIGSTVLAGTVELHTKTSEWRKHGHQHDDNYRSVILHVVYKHDEDFKSTIPVVELESRIPHMLLKHYDHLMSSGYFIACSKTIYKVTDIVWLAWKDRLLAERLERKSKRILHLLDQSNQHWEEVFWWLLARNFGATVNTDAFENIARAIPVKMIARHRHSIHQLEALLFGQANLLQTAFEEDYPKLLQREYQFLKLKYSLKASSIPVHFLRMRPGNFPTIRLAQLAALLQGSASLFSPMLDIEDVKQVRESLNVTANDYWHYHYRFDHPSPYKIKLLGKSSIDSIIINTIVPVLFAYGIYHKEEKYKLKAIRWLEEISAEQNVVTKAFAEVGTTLKNSFDSQALLELKTEYCIKKRCLECSVGHYLLKNNS
ncbi:MAG TPA: DUF2851 family protein [Chitinophagaceae bacterium]|nr:DUF2851 family protein [Chitinophagaceae bacterium]